MKETDGEIDVIEFLHKLQDISMEMRDGDGDSYYKLRELLQPYKGTKLLKLCFTLPPLAFAPMWMLHTFVFVYLEDTFGGDSYGYPAKEGEKCMKLIIINLGRFIQEAIFSTSNPAVSISDTLMNYVKLVKVKENSKIHPDDPDGWHKL